MKLKKKKKENPEKYLISYNLLRESSNCLFHREIALPEYLQKHDFARLAPRILNSQNWTIRDYRVCAWRTSSLREMQVRSLPSPLGHRRAVHLSVQQVGQWWRAGKKWFLERFHARLGQSRSVGMSRQCARVFRGKINFYWCLRIGVARFGFGMGSVRAGKGMSCRGRIVSARRRVSLIKTRSLHRHLFLCTESSHPFFAQHGNKIMSESIYIHNLLSLFLPPLSLLLSITRFISWPCLQPEHHENQKKVIQWLSESLNSWLGRTWLPR